jgi:hypothetical protein
MTLHKKTPPLFEGRGFFSARARELALMIRTYSLLSSYFRQLQ